MKLLATKNFFELEIGPEDLPLEQICPGATGGGCSLGKNKAGGNCSTCGGRGIVPTPLGLHILSFVIRHAAAYRAQTKKQF